MFGYFKLMYPAPLSEPIQTRDSNAYLLDTLRMSGMNLRNDFGVGRKIWRVFSFTYNMLVLPISFPINYTIHLAEFPPDLLLQSLQLCLNTWCFALKFFTLVIYMTRLELANKHFDELDEYCKAPVEKRKVRDAVAAITRLYLTFCVVYILYATSTLLDGMFHDRVPFNTYYPFVNWRIDRTQLYIQTFLEYLTVGYAIFVATATDSYPVIYVVALRTHILLLKDRVIHLGETSNSEGSNDADFMFTSLVDCIKAHRTMLNFCEAIKPIISGTIFAQFIICGSILGIIMINMVLFADQSTRFGIITYVMAVLLQTFPLCFYCNAIVDDCNELADALFHSAWWMQDKRYQRVALQFLQKLQQPMTFTAMNIFINLATNINVAKFAFTVYAIASGMNLDEKLQIQET
ncbi:hypothetical protein KR038_002790 [Drosophila bunnanda]|nr:hypothetical protein KR038_002790 [Drosophila bunnanda]